MALLGNMSVLHKSPAKYLTGTVGFNDRANWNKPGMMRSRGDLTLSTLWKFDAVPSGMMAGRAFLAPQTAGRIVTRTPFSINGTAVGALGKPASATANFAINASSIGGLIAGGVANATITINGVAAIAGLAAGSASGSLAINASAIIGATAWGIANSTMTVNGSAVSFGRGFMVASTVDNTTLTPISITNAVWSALSTDYNAAGTMGNKLNSAASGGVDYSALGAAVWAHATRTLTSGSPTAEQNADAVWAKLIEDGHSAEEMIRIALAALAGTSNTDGSTITFKGLDGTTDRIVGTFDANNNRTGVTVNGD